MGSRGKKRKRADGSVAGKQSTGRRLQPSLPSLEAVDVELLRRALGIEMMLAPTADKVSDDTTEQTVDMIEELAINNGADPDALAIRAGKLADLMRNGVDLSDLLLAHAANSKVDGSAAPLRWPLFE